MACYEMSIWLWGMAICRCFMDVGLGLGLAKGMAVCGCFVVVEWCLWVSLVFVGFYLFI